MLRKLLVAIILSTAMFTQTGCAGGGGGRMPSFGGSGISSGFSSGGT